MKFTNILILCFTTVCPSNEHEDVSVYNGHFSAVDYAPLINGNQPNPYDYYSVQTEYYKKVPEKHYNRFSKTGKALDDQWKLRSAYLECTSETKVDPEQVRDFRTGKMHDTLKFRKWILCVMYKIDLMTLQGVYRYDTAMSKVHSIDKADADIIIDECLSEKPIPVLEKAYNYIKCILKRDKKNYFPSLGISLPAMKFT